MARDAGARKVICASCAPPITHAHIYGIDLASPRELIASDKDRFEIAKVIGADEVIFQDLDDLKDACKELSPPDGPKDFEIGVFCGTYATEVPEGYFDHLAELHGEKPNGAKLSGSLVANSGPVNAMNGANSGKDQGRVVMEEDINLHNVVNDRVGGRMN